MAKTNPAQCARMKTAIAAEVGNIQGMAERYLSESRDYLVNRIAQKSYDTSEGEDPIKVRYSTAPIEEREYVDMLATGEEDGTMLGRNCLGDDASISTSINSKGAYGCSLPGQTLHGGYDVFYRRLKGKAYETDPICVLDLVLKEHYNSYLAMLHRDLPRRAVEQFEYSLERNVIEGARYNTACVNGFITGAGAFPTEPQGTLDLGTVRRVFNILEAQGWQGAREITTSAEAFETMRLNYKNNTGLELQATLVSPETHYLDEGTTVLDWAGIRWVLTKRPLRGWLRTITGGAKVFVPVRPTRARAGTGQGVVADVNEDYFNCSVYCDGERHELYEVGFYISKDAASRESFAVPQVADKRFSQNLFNFEVKMVDGAYIPCNVDNFMFYMRLMHAYAFESLYPEQMGAIIYRVQPDLIYLNTPVGCVIPENGGDISMQPASPQVLDDCAYNNLTDDCADDVAVDLAPAPTEGGGYTTAVGTIRFVNTAIITETDVGTLKVWVERVGGSSGAASVILNTSAGTGVIGTDFTDIAATTLNWAAGETGRKSVTVTILPGGAGEVTFNVDRTTPTGAAWAGPTTAVVTIDPPFTELP